MNGRPHIHVAGVGGVGMSALAELLLARGYRVTGSDRTLDQGGASEAVETLKAAGLVVVPQDGLALTAATQALAVSTAIESDNPELLAARRLNVRVVHRAALLAEQASGAKVIAITGTAGKTTVTALVGWLLEQAGFDPTVVNGGIILDWRGPARLGNVRVGKSGWWVLEADESDRSLLNFHPAHAVITNISKDHFELDEVHRLFRAFAAQVQGDIVGGPGVGAVVGRSVLEPAAAIAHSADGWTFDIDGTRYCTRMPGRHNAENALLAITLCLRMGAAPELLRDALARFGGVHRRLEVVGEFRGARVIDDYAHNPAKIAASWRAVGENARRVLGYWRPHGFAPLALMHDELVAALAGAMGPDDRIFVLPVFYAGGTAKRVIDAPDFVAALRARGLAAECVPDYAVLRARLDAETQPGDAILGMGARDPELPRFARSLAAAPTPDT
ncbi:MAG TPA: Mur ligase domain-containing protein [Kiritimatiellia bacterium]|nr:Mur ligase domain-containing protein [Kiritimatiellia bacterium]